MKARYQVRLCAKRYQHRISDDARLLHAKLGDGHKRVVCKCKESRKAMSAMWADVCCAAAAAALEERGSWMHDDAVRPGL